MKTNKRDRKPNAARGNLPEKTPGLGIWSGTVSFSLVAIPVRLVRAVEPGRVSFRMLHGKDYSPLERKMFCPEENVMVPPEETVRGYEIAPGKNVMVTDKELESVSPARSRTIEIAEFVDESEIDPLYYDHPYYLVPLKGGEKSYSLLAEAMRQTKRAGIAKFVLDEREYLVTVTSREGALVLYTLHYSDELLPEDRGALKKEDADDREKNAIKGGIQKMMKGFSPGKYADERKEKLMRILKKKIKEKAQVEAPEIEEEAGGGMTDLMAALEKSMRTMKKAR